MPRFIWSAAHPNRVSEPRLFGPVAHTNSNYYSILVNLRLEVGTLEETRSAHSELPNKMSNSKYPNDHPASAYRSLEPGGHVLSLLRKKK